MNPENTENKQPQEAPQSAPPNQPPAQNASPQTPPSGWQQPPQGKPPFGWIPPQGYQPQWPQQPVPPRYATPAYQLPPEREPGIKAEALSKRGGLVLLFCWIISVLFCELVFRSVVALSGVGIGILITTVLFCAGTSVYLHKSGKKVPATAYVLLLPITLFALSCFLFDSGFTHFLNILMLFALMLTQLLVMSGISKSKLFSPAQAFEVLEICIGRALFHMGKPFAALFKKREKKVSKNLQKILTGLLISLPFVIIFIALFSGADQIFNHYLVNFFDEIDIDFDAVFFDLFFGTLIAIFMAALLFTLRGSKAKDPPKYKVNGKLSAAGVAGFIAVIDLLHIIFVALQFGYLFTPGKELPGNLTYAEYARGGFFELCFASFISISIIVFISLLARKSENDRLNPVVATLLSVLAVCEIIICVSAIYRMLKYISVYNLTVLRVAVCYATAIIGLCLLGMMIKLWLPKTRAMTFAAVVILLMTLALNFANTDRLIARVNVDRYLSDTSGREVDLYYLERLSPAVLPELERLLEDGNMDKDQIYYTMGVISDKLDLRKPGGFHLSDTEAEKILDKYWYEIHEFSDCPWYEPEYGR